MKKLIIVICVCLLLFGCEKVVKETVTETQYVDRHTTVTENILVPPYNIVAEDFFPQSDVDDVYVYVYPDGRSTQSLYALGDYFADGHNFTKPKWCLWFLDINSESFTASNQFARYTESVLYVKVDGSYERVER